MYIGLQVEAKTPFARWYEPGSHPLPDDAASADMYRMASMYLQQSGYEHYEISNYAKPGYRCAPLLRKSHKLNICLATCTQHSSCFDSCYSCLCRVYGAEPVCFPSKSVLIDYAAHLIRTQVL